MKRSMYQQLDIIKEFFLLIFFFFFKIMSMHYKLEIRYVVCGFTRIILRTWWMKHYNILKMMEGETSKY